MSGAPVTPAPRALRRTGPARLSRRGLLGSSLAGLIGLGLRPALAAVPAAASAEARSARLRADSGVHIGRVAEVRLV